MRENHRFIITSSHSCNSFTLTERPEEVEVNPNYLPMLDMLSDTRDTLVGLSLVHARLQQLRLREPKSGYATKYVLVI